MLPRGLRSVLQDRRLFWLGALPPLITSVLTIVVVVVLSINASDLIAWLTPFADGWAVAGAFRIVLAIALVLAAVLLMVITFSALTLALGAPMYDKIAELVDTAEGSDVEEPEQRLARAIVRGVGQAIVMIAISAVIAIGLFALGFIPVVGQTLVPVASALFGGWMMTLELTGSAFERHARPRMAQRRAAMRRRRLRSLAFGVPCFLLLSIPLVSVLVFPAAAAGGTLLARSLVADDHPAGG